MGSSKKRKEPPPNRTLLDFFSGSDLPKRARVKASQHLAPGTGQTAREIIIIDSDDDGDDVQERKIGSVRSDRGIGVSGHLLYLDSGPSTLTRSPDKVTFGVPSALLLPPDPCTDPSSNGLHVQNTPTSPRLGHAESMFGISAPLLQERSDGNQPPERVQTDLDLYGNKSITLGGDLASKLEVEFPIGEWATEDDELVASEGLDNDAEIDEGEDEVLNDQGLCPVCGVNLVGVPVPEAQIHANKCLDATNPNEENTVVQKRCTSTVASIRFDLASGDGDSSTPSKNQGTDLFSILMNSHKDNGIWAEADATADRKLKRTRGNRRKAPFYKILQGMPIAVDAFCYGTIPGVTAYFLSHAHSDHYTNLGSKWNSGPIYCSEETANLITHMLAVDPVWIHPLPLDTPTIIPNTGGVSVTLIEANHCPGSCLFFFEGQQTTDAGDSPVQSHFMGSSRIFRYLHCGDFRASPRHVVHPAVNGKHIDHIYLDTTYLDPKYTFSPQPLVISACVELARRLVMQEFNGDSNTFANRNLTIDAWMKSPTSVEDRTERAELQRTVVVVGTYSIGKERIVKAIAQALGAKIYCDPRKTAILRCQVDKELHALLTADPMEANVHLMPLGTVTSDNLKSYLQRLKGKFSRVIGFRPTGWTYSPQSGSDLSSGSIQSIITRGQSRHFSYTDLQPSPKSSYNIQIFGVPYSEHSSFLELTCFAMSCDWGRMIPTVNVGSSTARIKMAKWLKRWELEKRSTKPSIVPPRTVDYW